MICEFTARSFYCCNNQASAGGGQSDAADKPLSCLSFREVKTNNLLALLLILHDLSNMLM